LQQGIRAYRDLEFDAAAGFLRQSLAGSTPELEPSDRAEAFTYLAATQVFRGNADSAEASFRGLVLLDVRYQPDRLVFPPDVTNVYDRVRRETKVVTIEAPARYELSPGEDVFAATLHGSSFHQVRAALQGSDGQELVVVYRGPIVDSIEVRWDGLDATGRYFESGSYSVSVVSIDSSGTPLRTVRLPLDVQAVFPDTLRHPDPPADSLLLPEFNPSGPGVEALVGGLLTGGALMLLPGALASGTDLGSAQYLVGGAVSVAGIIGFLTHQPGKEIPANVEANTLLRRDWQRRTEEVTRVNQARRADVRLVIETGPATIVEHGSGTR
jgi:hypothetical protein